VARVRAVVEEARGSPAASRWRVISAPSLVRVVGRGAGPAVRSRGVAGFVEEAHDGKDKERKRKGKY
jgi:hypothetical protein